MAGRQDPHPRLIPARPAADQEAAGYMPRIPWRLLLLGTLSVGTVATGYWVSQRHKAEALRSQIIQVHEQELAEPARRYLELRGKLEGMILEAASRAPDDFADRRLRLSGLRAGKGLYLRLTAKDAASRQGIEKGADAMEGDAIPSCLGLAPASARGLWEKGAFLAPDFVKRVRKSSGVMPLRVLDTMLANHIRTDLPVVLNLMRSDWFLLVIQQGESRREQPVDVFLWDLRSKQQLLRGRVQAAGVLLSVRVKSKDAPPGPRRAPDQLEAATANDCSIAAKIKALAGAPLASVENEQPPLPAAPAPAATPNAPAPATGAATPKAAQPAPAAAPEPAPAASQPAPTTAPAKP